MTCSSSVSTSNPWTDLNVGVWLLATLILLSGCINLINDAQCCIQWCDLHSLHHIITCRQCFRNLWTMLRTITGLRKGWSAPLHSILSIHRPNHYFCPYDIYWYGSECVFGSAGSKYLWIALRSCFFVSVVGFSGSMGGSKPPMKTLSKSFV